MSERRVVITGLGVVSSSGIGVDDWWQNLTKGKSMINNITSFHLEDDIIPLGAEIKNFEFERLFPEGMEYFDYLDRGMQFGFVAAKEAYKDANLKEDRLTLNKDRIGVYVGSTTGGIISAYKEAKKSILDETYKNIKKNIVYCFPPGVWASLLAHYFRVDGLSKVVGTSCYAGGEAIGHAYRDIKEGKLEIVIVGGADAPILITNYLSFYLIGATSRWKGDPREACKPFSKDRDGMVFGEGAAFIVLEELGSALKRDANIYAEIIGYRATSDGNHMVHPAEDATRYAAAITQALQEAKIAPKDVAYVSCHGTGTSANDRTEVKAIKKALGSHSYNICINSIKSMIGHCFGGATAIEVVGLVKTLQTKIVPPTINYNEFDPDCDLDCVPNQARKLTRCNYAVKTASGFGGSNMAMVVRNWS